MSVSQFSKIYIYAVFEGTACFGHCKLWVVQAVKNNSNPSLEKELNSSSFFNSLVDTKFHIVVPFSRFINMTFSCDATIYRACIHGDIPMIAFVIFVYLATVLQDYWFGLYHKLPPYVKSPKRHCLKIGTWVLLSAIMLGFG
ncbi:hypothetical protein VNO77_21195 [Canavalia gladiata]|uniref:Uncharacterized protein n=1 Tax=Canavalia gladiata TaxID=3824 RepID=A0AAN9QK22_CANGL